MASVTDDREITALFETFFTCQKVLLYSLDYREIRFSRHQFYALLALGSKGEMTMGQVAESIAASREQATRVIAPLVEEGYAERFYDETNRKLVFVRLTPKGKAFIQKEKKYVKEQLKQRFGQLSPYELERFLGCVSEIKTILKKVESKDK